MLPPWVAVFVFLPNEILAFAPLPHDIERR